MNPPRDCEAEAAEPSGLGHVLRATLSQAWDYAYLVIAGSLLWGLSAALPLAAVALVRDMRIAAAGLYLVGALTVGPMTVALYGMSQDMARRELPSLGALFGALRRFYWRAVALFLVQAFLLGGMLLAAWFYQAHFDHWLLEGLSLLWVYAALFWTMMNLYVPALLVRADGPVLGALRNGALLTLAHPGYTFLVLLQIACLLLLVALPVFARSNLALGVSFLVFFLLLPGFVPLLATNALNDLLRRHGG
ncbi:MAG: hypothetical protein FJX74_07635 [Armatimonadetes bacterium]|nr:hypothetical protein [Armatimonadota bacterium]